MSSSHADPDAQLMVLVTQGDRLAFQRLVSTWKHPLVNYFYRQVAQAELSEDLAQEVFVKVWKTKNYVPHAKFSSWLYRLAYHVLADEYRRQGRRVPTTPEETPLITLASSENIEQSLLQQESAAQLHAAMNSLSPKQRHILVLSKFHDRKYADIAEDLGCSVENVKVQVFRAIKQLGKKLKEGPSC